MNGIKEFKTEEFFHVNGQLSYRATRAILFPQNAHLYSQRRLSDEGYEWIYVGVCGKWKKNGKQQWALNYNSKGELLKNIPNIADI